MSAAVLFGSISARIVAYLAPLVAVPVVSRVPDPRPATFLRVLRTGGPRVDEVTEQAQLTVEAWSVDNAAAEDLANLARAHLQAMRGTSHGVYRVDELAGPGYLPDPDSYQHRWTFTVAVRVRGARFP